MYVTYWLSSRKIHQGCKDSRDDDPEELKPVEEGDANKRRVSHVIERRPEQNDEWDEQQQKEPGAPLFFRTSRHRMFSFCDVIREDVPSVWLSFQEILEIPTVRLPGDRACLDVSVQQNALKCIDVPQWCERRAIWLINPTAFPLKCQSSTGFFFGFLAFHNFPADSAKNTSDMQ